MVTVSVAVCPIMDSSSSSLTSCEITYDEEVEEQLSPDVRDAVENGVNSSYLQGNDITDYGRRPPFSMSLVLL